MGGQCLGWKQGHQKKGAFMETKIKVDCWIQKNINNRPLHYEKIANEMVV